jgi:hypothetical protein
MELRRVGVGKKIDQAASLRSHGRCRRSPSDAGRSNNQEGQTMKGKYQWISK